MQISNVNEEEKMEDSSDEIPTIGINCKLNSNDAEDRVQAKHQFVCSRMIDTA